MNNNQQDKIFMVNVVMSMKPRFKLTREAIEEHVSYALRDNEYYRDKLPDIKNWSVEELITAFEHEGNAITTAALEHMTRGNYYNIIDYINTESASCVPSKKVN